MVIFCFLECCLFTIHGCVRVFFFCNMLNPSCFFSLSLWIPFILIGYRLLHWYCDVCYPAFMITAFIVQNRVIKKTSRLIAISSSCKNRRIYWSPFLNLMLYTFSFWSKNLNLKTEGFFIKKNLFTCIITCLMEWNMFY